MDLSKLTLGERIVLGAGFFLILDLLFFPWYDVGPLFGGTRRAVDPPHSFYGVVALLVTIVMFGHVVVWRLASATLPELPVSWGVVHLVAGVAVLGLLLMKLLTETDFLSYGAYLGLLLAAVLAYGGYVINRETSYNRPAGGRPGI